jgi:RNA polymerase sigma-70 factor (ECF subfamily)
MRVHEGPKSGGHRVRLDVEGFDAPVAAPETFPEIDELLKQLALEDSRMAQVVELKFFGGLTNAEIGEALGVNERTVKRDWQVARAWLYARLTG